MNCPQCHLLVAESTIACSGCGFTANGRSWEKWSNLKFLLAEMAGWNIPDVHLSPLRKQYTQRLKESEIEIGIRQPPPTEAEARILHKQLLREIALQQALQRWIQQGWIVPALAKEPLSQIEQIIEQLNQKLTDAPHVYLPSAGPEYNLHCLAEQKYILQSAQTWHKAGLISDQSWQLIATEQKAKIEALEIKAGLRTATVAARKADQISTDADEEVMPTEKRWQRPSLTWDQVWESLLSERTLHALLFIGVILLLASGVSWLVWNWDTFPPLIQLGFLGGMTAAFFGAGWFVRSKMKLEGSGVALFTVAALLIPLDFVAYYISGGFPPGSWPTIWLIASVVCLVAYALITTFIHAVFLGYLVALALGSLLLSILNIVGVPVEWGLTAVTAFTLGLASSHEAIRRWQNDTWHFMGIAFGHIALVISAPMMIVGLGWATLVGGSSLSFYLSLAISWWCGGFTLLLMNNRYRLQTLTWAVALSFPIAIWLTMNPLFYGWQIDTAWYALGWLLLAPFYFMTAAYAQRLKADVFFADARKTAVIVGTLLVVIAAIWSWQDPFTAACVYLLLALGLAVGAWLTQQTRLLWLMSLSLAISSGAWMASRGANPAELALPWTMLSILHVIAALRLEKRLPEKQVSFLAPLYGAAILLAGTAVLPALILFDQQLLIYALANWLGINSWLALLAHQQNPALLALLHTPRLRGQGAVLLHWFVSLPLVAWVILLWTISREPSPQLGWILLILGWIMMGLAVKSRQLRWAYGLPWQVASIGAALLPLGLLFYAYEAALGSFLVAATAVYFTVAVWTFRSSKYFFLAGVLFPVAWALIYEFTQMHDLLNIPSKYWQIGFGAFPFAYVIGGIWLEERRGYERPFTKPFYQIALLISLPMLAASLLWSLGSVFNDDSNLVWTAFTPAWLGLTAMAYAWLTRQSKWGHIGIWLVTLAGGLVVKTYSQGSGRSAALVAIGAAAYILAERGLHQLARRPRKTQRLDYRRLWLVYKRPLLVAGWVLSVAAIGAALVRNLILLGGGTTRQIWSIIALSIVTGLYGLSAYLFKRTHFVWFASVLVIAPWMLISDLIFRGVTAWYGLSGVLLGLVLLAVGAKLASRLGQGKWSWPPQVVAHLLVPFSFLLTISEPAVASLTALLMIGFYLGATAIDRFYGEGELLSARFLYAVAGLLPTWALFTCLWIAPTSSLGTLSLIIWVFTLPLILLGKWVSRWEPVYRWPFYMTAYAVATFAMLMTPENTAVTTLLLFLNTGVAIFSVWFFRISVWWYPATILLPLAIWSLLDTLQIRDIRYYGWALSFVAGLYLAGAWLLRRRNLQMYEMPLIVMTFVVTALSLPLCSSDRLDAFVGYGMAVIILTLAAIWLRHALPLNIAVWLAIVPYGVLLSWLDVSFENLGFAMWPGILIALVLAVQLDTHWGIEPLGEQLKLSSVAFPWKDPFQWPRATWERWSRWWAMSLYGLAIAFVLFSSLVAVEEAWRWLLVLLAGTAVFLWFTFRFQLRIWLLAAGVWGQFAALALIRLLGLTDSGAQLALAFVPVMLLTLFLGFLVEQGLQEKPILYTENGRWYLSLSGWSLPFYFLLALNIAFAQLFALDLGWESILVTLVNGIIIAILATHWQLKILAYQATAFGVLTVLIGLIWFELPSSQWPTVFAILALVYGVSGYALRRWRLMNLVLRDWMMIWERPLLWAGWIVSASSLFYVLLLGISLLPSTLELVTSSYHLTATETAVAYTLVRTFALLGLFYLTAALVERRYRFSYFALLLLFASWSTWLLLIQEAQEIQLYAIPAGFYLLGMSWLEWARGNKTIARWLDWVGVIILFGSAFWQSFGANGEIYAFIMIVEGLLIGWLGSARRLRRLLYMGVFGVVTAVIGQLIEPLFALNTFVLLLLGVGVVGLAIALERRLDKVREFSHELRAKMEHWE